MTSYTQWTLAVIITTNVYESTSEIRTTLYTERVCGLKDVQNTAERYHVVIYSVSFQQTFAIGWSSIEGIVILTNSNSSSIKDKSRITDMCGSCPLKIWCSIIRGVLYMSTHQRSYCLTDS